MIINVCWTGPFNPTVVRTSVFGMHLPTHEIRSEGCHYSPWNYSHIVAVNAQALLLNSNHSPGG